MTSYIDNSLRIELIDAQTGKVTDITSSTQKLTFTFEQFGAAVRQCAGAFGRLENVIGSFALTADAFVNDCIADLIATERQARWLWLRRKAWLLTVVLALVAVVTG